MANFRKLTEKVADNVLAQTIAFIIGIGFFGGAAYILILGPSEVKQVQMDLERFDIPLREEEEFLSLLDTALSGQLNSHITDTAKLHILDALTQNLHLNRLDSAFRQTVLNWCYESENNLSTERSRIAGIVLRDQWNHDMQLRILGAYDAQIDFINELQDLVLNWSGTDSVAVRERRMTLIDCEDQLRYKQIEFLTVLRQIPSKARDGLRRIQTEHQGLKSDNDSIGRKVDLALVGVVAGLMVYFFIGHVAFRRSLHKRKTS